MARPAILNRPTQSGEDDRFSVANAFNALGRATKTIAIGTGLAVMFGLIAAPTAVATVTAVAVMWGLGYTEQTLGNYMRQEDKAVRDAKLGEPVQKPSIFKAMRSALTII